MRLKYAAIIGISLSIGLISFVNSVSGGQIYDEGWGKFSKSCSNIQLKMGFFGSISTLKAHCTPNLNYSALNIGKYISNNNGHLTWSSSGPFHHTCESCELKKDLDFTVLHCKCKTKQGTVNSTKLFLDQKIANYCGKLKYVNEGETLKPCPSANERPSFWIHDEY